MSKNNVVAFVQKVSSDPNLQSKVTGLNGSIEGLVRLASETGYPFTAQDWQAAVSGELNEDDLNNVAGGIVVQKGLIGGIVVQNNLWGAFTEWN